MWKINRLQKAKENGVIKYVQESLFLLFIALFVSCSTPEQAANESLPYGDFPLRQYWSYQADGNIVTLTEDDTFIFRT